MKGIFYIAVFVLIFSGCVSEQPAITPTATPAVTTAPAQIETPTPAPTTPVPSIPPAIKVISYPAIVTGDENFTITWEVSGGLLGEITHSAVHWGYRSGGADIKDYGYFSRVYTGKTPQQFSVTLKAPSGGGPLYFRAHALVDGMDVYTPEYTITINPKYTGGGGY